MKLFLFIALIALIAVLILAMRRSGTSITTIEHRRDQSSDREGEDEL